MMKVWNLYARCLPYTLQHHTHGAPMPVFFDGIAHTVADLLVLLMLLRCEMAMCTLLLGSLIQEQALCTQSPICCVLLVAEHMSATLGHWRNSSCHIQSLHMNWVNTANSLIS